MQSHTPDNSLLTVTEVADWLRIHPETVRRYLRRRLLHGVKVREAGRAGWRVHPQDVKSFMQMEDGVFV